MDIKGKNSESIRKYTDNTPRSGVSVDQLQSVQPGLVPLLSVKLTSVPIWDAQVMVDHFSDLTYVQLIRSTIQEETLAGKPAFEILAATFGIRIKRYHAYNGRFSEQPFRSSIEDSNQTIKFYGVGSHHQNAIVERKIQNLTLGSKTLLLHAKIYCPEEITTMLWSYSLKDFA